MLKSSAVALVATGLLAVFSACGSSDDVEPADQDGFDGGADPDGDGGVSTDVQECAPGTFVDCYSGPPETDHVGACKPGVRVCDASGSLGECTGEVTPVDETCATVVDDDCDGEVNEAGIGCFCEPGQESECYAGPADTEGVGACKAGVQVCKPDGSGFGACLGEVIPTAELCATTTDDDCDGELNEEGPDCTCVPNETEACYSGPLGTADVGACKSGGKTCNSLGTGFGPCVGEVLPAVETCGSPADDDCDGFANEDGIDCVCTPSTVLSCYSGPAGTAGVGACKNGQETCNALGTGYSGCVGQVTPLAESCATIPDDDCDNVAECPGDVSLVKSLAESNDPTVLHPLIGNTPKLGLVHYNGVFQSPRHLKAFDASGNATTLRVIPNLQSGRLVNGPYLVGVYSNGSVDMGGGALPPPGEPSLALARYDYSGAHVWSRGYPQTVGFVDSFSVVGTLTQLDLFVSGRFWQFLDLGLGLLPEQGLYSHFLARISLVNGDPVWNHTMLAAGSAGSVVEVVGMVPSSHGPLLAGRYTGPVTFGTTALPDPGSTTRGAFLASFNSNGQHVWSKGFTATGASDLKPTAFFPIGSEFMLVGTSDAPVSFGGPVLQPGMFVVRLGSSGNHVSSLSIPNCTNPIGAASNSFHYVVAQCAPSVDVGFGPVSGRVLFIWVGDTLRASRSFGNTDITALSTDYHMAGTFSATANFPPAGKLTSASGKDLFFAKFVQ
jgi:hypothetical protein